VLNIGKVLGGKESYYLDQVARSQQDYYTGAGEAPGVWMGTAATELGIAGEVKDDGLRRVLAGAHPDTAARLTSPPRGRRVAAFDLTFRAPKSVSLLYGLGELDVTRQVRHAHETALAEAIDYLERHAAVARRGHGGRTRVDGSGFLAAAFQHRSSRLGDPLLHHHVLVANYTRGPDGRWTALDGRVLFAQAKTAGYLYQAALRRELTRRLGVAWQPVANGVADIAGVPRQVIEAFSKRRQQITTRLAERGEHSAKAAQVAALDTRPAKQHQPSDQTLRARWRREAGQLGFTARTLERTLGQARPRPLSDADSAGMCVQQLGRRGAPKGGHHDVTERQAHGSQPVGVRPGETPGSPVARPPASGEIPASRRGAARLTSPQHQAKPAASLGIPARAGQGGAEPAFQWRRPWTAPGSLERVPRNPPA